MGEVELLQSTVNPRWQLGILGEMQEACQSLFLLLRISGIWLRHYPEIMKCRRGVYASRNCGALLENFALTKDYADGADDTESACEMHGNTS